MSSHESLNPDQFNIDYPFPRLRKAYTRAWVNEARPWLKSEGMSDEGIVDFGHDQAKLIVENALYPDNEPGSIERHMLGEAFRLRHES